MLCQAKVDTEKIIIERVIIQIVAHLKKGFGVMLSRVTTVGNGLELD